MKTVTIIGGGITGVFIAYFLSQYNYKVKLLDDNEEKGKATAVNPGGLNPMHGPAIPGLASNFALTSFHLHINHWQRIRQLSQIDFHPRFVSRIELLFTEDDEKNHVEAARLYENTAGFSSQWLGTASLRKRVPQVNQFASGGLLMNGNACVDSGLYRQAILTAALKQGVEFFETRASGIKCKGKKIVAIKTNTGEIKCDEVVFACGAWVDKPADWLNISIPVTPIKGELLLLKIPELTTPYDITWQQNGLYHKSGNEYWAGGTHKPSGFNAMPTTEGCNIILSNLSHMLPGLNHIREISHQTGLRPVTPDGLPIVDKIQGWGNVYIVTGSGVKGILLSAGLGKMAATMVNTNSGINELDKSLDFLSLGRF